MLFYIMMLETKGILARSLFFPPGKQRLTYPIKSHKREDRRKDSLRSLIGVFAVIPLVNGMAGTAFSASADADRRDSKADLDSAPVLLLWRWQQRLWKLRLLIYRTFYTRMIDHPGVRIFRTPND